MEFFEYLINAFDFSAKADIPFTLDRIDWLDTWFDRKNLWYLIELYKRLDDDNSRQLLLQIITKTITVTFGSTHDLWQMISKNEWEGYRARLTSLHCVEDANEIDKIQIFVLDGYSYGDICSVAPGDIVYDCGAYTGNTALYFSQKCGKDGTVYSFEAMPETYNTLKANIEKFSLSNVRPYNYATFDKSCELTFTAQASPGSTVISGNNGIKVKAVSIDEFTRLNNVGAVNFIKMDIEGSEVAALAGAREVINKFHPKLAICVYHKPSDFIEIPRKILAINPNYRFLLKHSCFDFRETVLFAYYDEQQNEIVIDDQEIDLSAILYDSFRNIYTKSAREMRKHILISCNELLNLDIKPVFDEKEYTFVLYPISSDEFLHYEFFFSQKAS